MRPPGLLQRPRPPTPSAPDERRKGSFEGATFSFTLPLVGRAPTSVVHRINGTGKACAHV
jgi:hypothetical protein